MHSTARAGVHWVPASDAERAAVLRQMDRLLNSHHFCNSKRYPAMLEYLIRETLAGKSDSLKERVLGNAVFRRPPDYDANADPVVRVTAAEIRRRIAQYYQEEGKADEIYIGLRPGSYVPEFYPIKPGISELEGPVMIQTDTEPVLPVVPASLPKRNPLSWRITASIIGISALVALATLAFLHRRTEDDQRVQLWGPLLDSPAPVLFVLGQPHAAKLDIHPVESVYDLNAAGELYLPDAIALAHLSNVLDAHHHLYQITGVTTTSLSDLRKGPAILVGGFNNPWTLRVLNPLRFSLRSVADKSGSPQILQIVDQKNQSGSPWTMDLQEPIGSITHDYAIVARFQSSMTDGVMMVVAGLGEGGTESASKFINSTTYVSELASRSPRHWNKMNMEAVLETEVIGGRTGHTRIIASEFW